MGYKKAFPQIVTYILQKAFLKHALENSHEKYFYHNFFSVNALTDKNIA